MIKISFAAALAVGAFASSQVMTTPPKSKLQDVDFESWECQVVDEGSYFCYDTMSAEWAILGQDYYMWCDEATQYCCVADYYEYFCADESYFMDVESKKALWWFWGDEEETVDETAVAPMTAKQAIWWFWDDEETDATVPEASKAAL